MITDTSIASDGRRCVFIRDGGVCCSSRPMTNRDYCFWHDPDKAEERRRAGKSGGSRGKTKCLPQDTEDFEVNDASTVVRLLERSINQTLRGEIDPKVANAVGYLSNIILRAREQCELDAKITEIEMKLATRRRI